MIRIVRRFKGNGMKFGKVNAAVRTQNVFFRAHIYNLSDDIPVLIDLEEAALQRHRKLVNQGSVHIFALRHMKARFFHLIGFIMSGNHAHIISRDHMRGIRKADGKCPSLLNIFGCLMSCTEAEHHLVGVVQAAPGSVHGISRSVFVEGCDNQNRQRVKP